MKKIAVLFPIISGGLWGSAGIFIRKLSDFGLNSYTIISSRVLIALIILFIGILILDKSLLKIKLKDAWVFMASGILGMLGLNFCYNESVNHLSLSLAAVLLSLSPIFVIFIAAILFKEKITLRKISCMLLAILGCILASGLLENNTGMKLSAIGILIGLLSAFFYALYSVVSKIAMGKGYEALTITFYSLLTLEIVLLPFTDWNILKDFVISAPVNNSIFMLLHSVFTSVLPYVLYTVSLSYIEAGKTSILAAGGEPISAMLLGMLFFSEVPTILSLIGLILTIVALSLLCMPSKNQVDELTIAN
ncbi:MULTISPECIES: DMT family transporter [Clostridium]|uniref:EamA family transporter n=1 Tax=Clostridium saudiense TaxID=1414720 RepID=A0ABS2FD44_9CLOT|nr:MULTISPECIES: EamA family transporter [Clostridium]MBM6818329.1 EamA family transporter [Clostridium saudiense]